MFQIQQQQQSMLYPTTTNKLRLSASPSGGGCIPVDVNDPTDTYTPCHQQQQVQLSTVSENGDATIDELFNADNGSDGVDIYCGGGGTDTLEKQFDFGIAGGGGGGGGSNQGQDQGNSQMDITDPMDSFELFL